MCLVYLFLKIESTKLLLQKNMKLYRGNKLIYLIESQRFNSNLINVLTKIRVQRLEIPVCIRNLPVFIETRRS